MSGRVRDSLRRFDGLAAGYDRHRPNYPSEAIDYFIKTCALQPSMQIVDVGCGTGISTRILAARGFNVIGIEPNTDMRRQARSIGTPSGPTASFQAGRADATGLPDACAAAVVAAQSFHWFANDSSLTEFRRLLIPGGWLALLWNEQDRSDPFTEAYYQALVRYSPEPDLAARTYHDSANVFLKSRLFQSLSNAVFAHQQSLDLNQLIGRAFSTSYVSREGVRRQKLEAELRAMFAKYQRGGELIMRYETAVYLGRKTFDS
jgi:ubiquinone/menaquinone biosynthesis C-methylase UbiE